MNFFCLLLCFLFLLYTLYKYLNIFLIWDVDVASFQILNPLITTSVVKHFQNCGWSVARVQSQCVQYFLSSSTLKLIYWSYALPLFCLQNCELVLKLIILLSGRTLISVPFNCLKWYLWCVWRCLSFYSLITTLQQGTTFSIFLRSMVSREKKLRDTANRKMSVFFLLNVCCYVQDGFVSIWTHCVTESGPVFWLKVIFHFLVQCFTSAFLFVLVCFFMTCFVFLQFLLLFCLDIFVSELSCCLHISSFLSLLSVIVMLVFYLYCLDAHLFLVACLPLSSLFL